MNLDRIATALVHGTPEHAAHITKDRHPGIRDGLQWLTPAHLPPALRPYSEPFYDAAVAMLIAIPTDSPELTTALNGLIAAKDSAVRAGIRHDTGRAGSVPRPQQVVSPPELTYTDETLHKVHAALKAVGLGDVGVTDAINGMQNQGVLFRERSQGA